MADVTTIAFMAESGHGKDFCGQWLATNQNFIMMAFADHIKRFCATVFKEFTDEALWGDAALRNIEVPVEWERAQFRMTWGVDDWIMQITNLSIDQRAAYKELVKKWFLDLQHRAFTDAQIRGNISPRIALQLLGTEYGRQFQQDIWSSYLLKEVIPKVPGNTYKRNFGVAPGSAEWTKRSVSGVVITDCRFGSELAAVQAHGGFVVKVVRNSLKNKANGAEEAGIKNHASEAEMRSIPDEAFDLILEMDDGADNVYPRLQKMWDTREFEARVLSGRPLWLPT